MESNVGDNCVGDCVILGECSLDFDKSAGREILGEGSLAVFSGERDTGDIETDHLSGVLDFRNRSFKTGFSPKNSWLSLDGLSRCFLSNLSSLTSSAFSGFRSLKKYLCIALSLGNNSSEIVASFHISTRDLEDRTLFPVV